MSTGRKVLAGFYLCCAMAGALVPWYFDIQHMMTSDVLITPVSFVQAGLVSPLASSITMDFLIGTTPVMVWMFVEGRRLGMKRLWLWIPAIFGIAFAFACPLFLFLRELRMARTDAA